MKSSLLFFLLAFAAGAAVAQDQATLDAAATDFDNGCTYYGNNDFPNAIASLRKSNKEVPSAIAWYFLGVIYDQTNAPQQALDAINAALLCRPPLASKYLASAKDIQRRSDFRLNQAKAAKSEGGTEKVGVSSDAITSPPVPIIRPGSQDNPYRVQPVVVNPARRSSGNIATTQVVFPGGGTRNNNGTIGDFCCTGETATILRSDNTPIGYVYFYGFKNGMNIGNNRSTATQLSLGVSATPDLQDATAPRLKDEIVFDAAHMFVGAVQTKKVGALSYTVTILAVHKYSPTAYYMGETRVRVEIQ